MNDEFKIQESTPKGGFFKSYVLQRIDKNKNFMCCITGSTGSGKTYSALSFAQKWDKNFTENNIVFTPKQFMDLMNSGTLKKGSVIVADEFGVSMNSRNWQSVANQVINFVLQTFRSKNYIVIFTSPDFGFIDVAARKLFHCHMTTNGIDFKNKTCSIKPYMLQINQRTGDVYYKYLIPIIKGLGEKKLNQIDVSLPTKQLIKQYEVKKDIFVDNLNKELLERINEKDNKAENTDRLEIEKQTKVDAVGKLRDKGSSWGDIADLFNFTTNESARKWFSRNRTDTTSLLHIKPISDRG